LFSLFRNVQTGSGLPPTSYSVGTGFFPGGRAVGASSWLLISIKCRG